VKIALVTETFPPEINGVAMTLHRVVQGLHKRGHSLEVICPKRKDRLDFDTENTFSWFFVRGLPIPKYSELRFGLPGFRQLTRHWTATRPDLIHIATEGPLGWSAARTAHKLKIPFITTFHTNFDAYGSHYGYGFLQKIVAAWMRSIRQHAQATFVPNAVLKTTLEANGFKHLAILSRGVDTELFAPEHRDPSLRASWGASPETPVAIYVGRIAGEKNIPLTVDAWLEMRAILPTLKLVIVGDGPERKKLEANYPDIHFAGMRRGQDLARHYASADTFLFASTTETFGNVVTEAMASGLAVLAYDYAAPHKYIVDEENGYLVPFDDAKQFLETSRKLAANQHQWSTIGAAARKTTLGISWDTVLDGFNQDIQNYAKL